MADKTRTERNPDGYAYRYHSQLGGTVLRFNHGEEVNGGRPFEVVPYWFSPPDPPRRDGWEALRELRATVLAAWDELIAAKKRHDPGSEMRVIAQAQANDLQGVIAAIDRLLAAAPKETP